MTTSSQEDAAQAYSDGDYARALSLAQSVLRESPGASAAVYIQVLALHRLGQESDAQAALGRAIQRGVDQVLYLALGELLKLKGDLPKAAEAFAHAILLDATLVPGFVGLAAALVDQGRVAEAVQVARRGLAVDPGHAGLLWIAAAGEQELGHVADAERFYRDILRLAPQDAGAAYALGSLLDRCARYEDAIAVIEPALDPPPRDARLAGRMGILLSALRSFLGSNAAALRAAQDSLAWDENALAHLSVGRELAMLARHEEALPHFERASSMAPHDEAVREGVLYPLSYHPALPAARIAARFNEWGDIAGANNKAAAPEFVRRPVGSRLRIGYVSSNFQNHTSRLYFEPLFRHHDKQRFETLAYHVCLQADDSGTDRLRPFFDHWRDARELSDADLQRVILADEVDILIDTTNQMSGHRLGVFARRAAPVQATWLGTCWTTGLAAMDYAISDAVMAPPEAEPLFREAVVRLDRPLFCYTRQLDQLPPVGPPPYRRNGRISFGYAGRIERLNRTVLRCWGRILAALPDARLVLDYRPFRYAEDRAHMAALLEESGIAPARVELRYTQGNWQALADMDIMLDSFPHSGGTMLFDGIVAGLPVITLASRPPVGRVGKLILNALAHPELVASDEEGYVDKAVSLATDRERLARLRALLRPRFLASQLCDGAGFASAMERAYSLMWRRYLEGEPPAAIWL